MNIGTTIRLLRKCRGFSQTTFAEKCKMAQPALSLIESGVRQPSKKTLNRICLVLEVPEALIYFLSIDESTIASNKKEKFKIIFPAIIELVKKIFFD